MKKKPKIHWYFIYTEECPVCGRGGSWRERVYGKKPKEQELRYAFRAKYDWCDV